MRIFKSQINFIKNYVSQDWGRPILQCVYLDMDTVDESKKYAKIVGTDGFILGSIQVELTENDKNSFYFPVNYLTIAKRFVLKHPFDFVKVEKIGDLINYSAGDVTISIDNIVHGEYPDYKKILTETNKPEYKICMDSKLLKRIAQSQIDLGYKDLRFGFNGLKKPISIQSGSEYMLSILMPITNAEMEIGSLQKDDKKRN